MGRAQSDQRGNAKGATQKNSTSSAKAFKGRGSFFNRQNPLLVCIHDDAPTKTKRKKLGGRP